MRQERIIQASIFDVFAEHEIGRELKAVSGWLDEHRELVWRCVAGHDPWKDGMFRFQLVGFEDGRTRLRFWQDYAVELDDDSYGSYNFNWGYYLESLRLFCTTGAGKPFHPPA